MKIRNKCDTRINSQQKQVQFHNGYSTTDYIHIINEAIKKWLNDTTIIKRNHLKQLELQQDFRHLGGRKQLNLQ